MKPTLALRGTIAAGLMALLTLTGCERGRGDVSGTVTLNGKPLPGGMVTFVPDNGPAEATRIGEDGKYAITNVLTGPARITVVTQQPVRMHENGKAFEPLGKYVPIPERYRDPEMSGLRLDVKRGFQECDLPLEQLQP
jgi:hypothetical protein